MKRFFGDSAFPTSKKVKAMEDQAKENEKSVQEILGANNTKHVHINTDEAIVKWLAVKNLPLNFFDDDATQDFFRSIQGNLATVPKKDVMKRKVSEQYLKRKNIVKQILNENTSKISFTVDGWTSVSGNCYYSIKAHFIDNDYNLQSLTIDFVPSKGRHTGKDIAEVFMQCLKDYNIAHKLMGITVDNAAANTTFIAELKRLMNNDDIKFSSDNQHFRCFAHILNLAVQDILKLLKCESQESNNDISETDSDSDSEEIADGSSITPSTLLFKLRKTYIKIRKSEQLQTKLKHCCDTVEVKFVRPILDVRTSWNGTFDMLENAAFLKDPLKLLYCNSKQVQHLKLNDDEWALIDTMRRYLKPFKQCSAILCGQKYVTISLVVVAFNMLLDKIDKFVAALSEKQRSNIEDIVLSACMAGKQKLLKHYNKCNWMYCAVLILDPRHKIETFDMTTWGKEMKTHSYSIFEETFRQNYYTEPKTLQLEQHNKTALIQTDGDDDDDLDIGSLFERVTEKQNWKSEIDDYLSSKRSSKEENLLEYWKRHHSSYPTLSKMARDFLAISATSAPVERMFSQASLIIRKQRSRLSDDSSKHLLCLNSWAKCGLKDNIWQKL